MIKGVGGLRPLKEQFAKQTVLRIRTLQDDLDALPFRDGAGRVYVKELSYALEAGLLLAALHLAASLLELFARDLLIYRTALKSASDQKNKMSVLDKLEVYYEDTTKPQWSFSMIVDELRSQRVISNTDAKNIKTYYQTIRIPIHHGLTRRFIRGRKKPDFEIDPSDIIEILMFGRTGRAIRLEDLLEDEGINLVKMVVAFVKKYSLNLKF
jgi:hypothetical protein